MLCDFSDHGVVVSVGASLDELCYKVPTGLLHAGFLAAFVCEGIFQVLAQFFRVDASADAFQFFQRLVGEESAASE